MAVSYTHLIIIDLLCVQFSYVLAYFFRHGLTNLYEVELYRNMALMIEIADLIVIFMLEQYKGVLRRGYYNEFVSVLKQMIFIELISSKMCIRDRQIIVLYEDDFKKIDPSGRLSSIYHSIPAQLSKEAKRYSLSKTLGRRKNEKDDSLIYDLIDSKTVIASYNSTRCV